MTQNRTDQELRQLAADCADGKVFGSWMLQTQDQISMVFMLIPLMGPADLAHLKASAYHVYEYLDKAGPRSINGMPMFLSLSTLTEEEWGKVRVWVVELLKQKDEFLNK